MAFTLHFAAQRHRQERTTLMQMPELGLKPFQRRGGFAHLADIYANVKPLQTQRMPSGELQCGDCAALHDAIFNVHNQDSVRLF